MPTYRAAFYQMKDALEALYDRGEATAIANHAFYHLTGLDKLDRMELMDKRMDKERVEKLAAMQEQLLRSVPFQYVVGQAWFLGRPFNVTPGVLIPRPETEELVLWLDEDFKKKTKAGLRMLEVGTGSGCIAVSMKCGYSTSEIVAVDISEGALNVARSNALRHKEEIDFRQLDFLDEAAREALGRFNAIISNPPYIPQSERGSLHANVREHEPAEALFVPDEDALVFYRAIAAFGAKHLAPGGVIYCELHQERAEAARAVFMEAGFEDVELRRDMHGAWRMLRAGM